MLKPNGRAVEAPPALEERHSWGLSFVARAIDPAAIVGGHARQVGPDVFGMGGYLQGLGHMKA